MATGPTTQVSDVVVPEIFTPYTQQLTEEKANIIQGGALMRDPFLDQQLAGGGLTFNVPSFRDLDNEADNVSTDDPADVTLAAFGTAGGATRADSFPLKTQTDQEIAVRLSRNNSWSSSDLAAALAGSDPMESIASRVGYYWTRRLQAVFIAIWNGVISDNTSNDSGDYTNDVSGSSYSAGVTDFSAEAFLDALVTMGDSQEDLGVVMVHSVVYNRMQKNNLIDFIPDARGETDIPTFLGRRVVVDDGMPVTGNVYDSWIFGAGATRLGVGTPKVATAVERHEAAGNGGGGEVLFNRVGWCLHPEGHAYVGTSPDGGPGNGSGANGLAAGGSWNRVWPERKMVKFARLVTREA